MSETDLAQPEESDEHVEAEASDDGDSPPSEADESLPSDDGEGAEGAPAEVESSLDGALDGLTEGLSKTRQLGGWVASALEHKEQFPPDVVRTVTQDYLAQYNEVLPGLLEQAEEASSRRQSLADTAQELEDKKAEVESQIDEFKLRHVIGELSAEDFANKEADARATVDEHALSVARAGMAEIDALLDEVGSIQHKVTALVEALKGAAQSMESVAPVSSSEDDSAEAIEAVADVEPAPEDDALGEAAYAAGGSGAEWDVEASSPGVPEPEAAAEAPDMSPPSDSTDAGEEGLESLEVSLDMAAAEPPPAAEKPELRETGLQPIADEALEQPAAAAPDDNAEEAAASSAGEAPGEGTRLAVTPPGGEQTIYPFTGDVMSLGRGRNNDIQIKNDGKISRYHCRIYRRGDGFVVEDNKSSNGTLVNGKLVTKQELHGGELVQLGETRVRFHLS